MIRDGRADFERVVDLWSAPYTPESRGHRVDPAPPLDRRSDRRG